MAGAIIIADKRGVSMSGLAFQHIIGAIRPIIRARDEPLAEQIWEPIDEGGMDFVSLEFLDRDSYRVFCESVRDASERDLKANPDSVFRSTWGELLDSLSTDPRAP